MGWIRGSLLVIAGFWTLNVLWADAIDLPLIPVLTPPHYSEARWRKLRDVFRTLSETQTGKRMLLQAGDLIHQVRWGNVSRTDSILSRQFDPATGAEKRVREITIFLRENQPARDSVLDLAHELTHALTGPQWDPYDPNLKASIYVSSVIEGSGGEVDALVTECRVALELADLHGWSPGRCASYETKGDERVSRAQIQEDFYRVGRWKGQIQKSLERLGEETASLPFLNENEPVFFSATGKAPYPAALLKEFGELTDIACGNTLKRLQTLSSATDQDPKQVRETTLQFLRKRCPRASAQLTRR